MNKNWIKELKIVIKNVEEENITKESGREIIMELLTEDRIILKKKDTPEFDGNGIG